MTLDGKNAIVTGGTGQLGRVIARNLGLRGARVFVASRNGPGSEGITPDDGPRFRFIRADVTRAEDVDALFADVARSDERADILVNCAGAFSRSGPLAGTPISDWDRMLAVNLRSVFLCCRAFLGQRSLGGYGRIVNFAAQTVFRPSTDRIPYAVAKGGVACLTEALGEELRGTGITANAIAPGIVRTDDNIRSMPDADASAWVEPEDIASEVIHLCGESAAAINGAVIPMFGGVKAQWH